DNHQVWFNDGMAGFTNSGQALGPFQHAENILGEVDADGDLDLFIFDDILASRLFLNDGAGGFTDSGQSFGSCRSADVGDVDGDGDLDAVVAGFNSPSQLLLNDGSGLFSSASGFSNHAWSSDLELADLDNDGDLDVVLATFNTLDQFWTNDGSGQFTHAPTTPAPFTDRKVSLGNIDQDADIDFATFTTAETRIKRNNLGTFTDHDQINDRCFKEMAFGDRDGDGDLDLFYTCTDSHMTHSLAVNDGAGNFTEADRYWLQGFDLSLGDLDGDGDLDVVVCNATKGPTVWLNAGCDNLPTDYALTHRAPATVFAGDEFNYFLCVTNPTVLPVTGLVVTDTLPASATFLSAPADCVFSNQQVIWTLQELSRESSTSIVIRVRSPLSPLTMTNEADLTVHPDDPDPGNNLTQTETVVLDRPFSVIDSMPPNAEAGAPDDGDILITFNQNLDPLSVDADTFRVTGHQSGPATGVFTFPALNQARFQPATAFDHGELVDVLLTDSLLSSTGAPLHAHSFSFRVEARGCTNLLFQPDAQQLGSNTTYRVETGDLDGDGDSDALVLNHARPGQVWINDGSGQFTAGQTLSIFSPTDVALGDLDGDGDLDAVISTLADSTRVWLNDGSGQFSDAGQLL
ncbi:MAG: FG-GAP-like repeat-containing protein, partial [Verrucomicrobiota bacterium]